MIQAHTWQRWSIGRAHRNEILSSNQYRFGDPDTVINWRESGHLWKIRGQPSRQIVPSFAARFSACFAYMDAHGDESGNY